MKYPGVIWVLAAVLPLADLQLELSSYPPFEGSYCPGNLTFVCRGMGVSFALTWYLNNSALHTYTFINTGDEQFPLTDYDMSGITIIIVNISFSPPATTLDITSTLTGDVSHLQGSTITCRDSSTTSSSLLVRLKDPPSRPLQSLCTLSNQYHLVLQWLTQVRGDALQVDYADNLQCSSINTDQSIGTLRCNGLKENKKYNFSITSLNCGSQRNGPYQFVLNIAKKLSTLFRTTISYFPEDIVFIRIDWNYRDLRDSILVHSIQSPSEGVPSTVIIMIIIEESPTGAVIFNETFPQKSGRFCDDLKCSILHNIVNERSTDSSYRVKMSAFNDILPTHCDVPLNHYIEVIPGSLAGLIDFRLLSISNSVYALCSSRANLSTCNLQYTRSPQYKNLTSTINIGLNIPYMLPEQLTLGENYYFRVILNLSLTLQIKTHYSRLFIHVVSYEEASEILPNDITTTDRSSQQLFVGYQTETAVIVVLVIIFIGLIIALTVIAVLCHKVKMHKKLEHLQCPNMNNRIDMQETSQEKQDCEIIYDEPNLRRSVYAEVKNDAYNRYEPHSADKIVSEDWVQNTTYNRPT